MAKYIAIQDHHNPLSQHGIASYVTKFESKSFRLRSDFGVALCSARKLLAQSAVTVCVCVCVQVKGQGEAKLWHFLLSR